MKKIIATFFSFYKKVKSDKFVESKDFNERTERLARGFINLG